ncbi:MAG TPA: TetR/AcrR family transcriptional regulator [Stenotrophobium sp.]|jgi:AcrR family transcriptional regulator|nr:TetR/AcrR family transcriptional regulator [Stenotrophobium sp.]
MSRKPLRAHAPRLAREARVDEILVAARDVFCEKGYENTAVAEIAARIGVVEGTVYKYFATKRDLLLKVLERWYEQMFGDYARDLAGVDNARARLRLLVWRHLRSIRDYPRLCRLMFREVRSEHDYHGSELHGLNRRYTGLLVDVLEQGVQRGDFRGDVPMTLLRDMVYGAIEHHAWNFICGRGALDIDAIADQITTLLCDGIATQSGSGTLKHETERLAQIAARIENSLPRQSRKT